MSAIHTISLAFGLVLSAAAVAQQSPGAAAAAEPMPQRCGMTMARHHGAEKGTPTPIKGACVMAEDGTPVKAKGTRGHDHAKFHKLM